MTLDFSHANNDDKWSEMPLINYLLIAVRHRIRTSEVRCYFYNAHTSGNQVKIKLKFISFKLQSSSIPIFSGSMDIFTLNAFWGVDIIPYTGQFVIERFFISNYSTSNGNHAIMFERNGIWFYFCNWYEMIGNSKFHVNYENRNESKLRLTKKKKISNIKCGQFFPRYSPIWCIFRVILCSVCFPLKI